MKRVSSILVCLALMIGLMPKALAVSGIVKESAAIGGGGSLVYIDLSGDRSIEVVTSGGNVCTDSAASTMVKGSLAAINGGFFNSYYSGNGNTFPGNYPSIYGAITQNGEIINAGGGNNTLGFTYDGKVLIDRVTFQTVAVVHGKNNFNVWGVNKLYDDASAISLLTPMLNLPVTVPQDSKIFTLKDGKITAVAGGGNYTVPVGFKLLIFNKTAVSDAQKWNTLPAVGDKVELAYTYAPSQSADNAQWNNLKTAVSGGRMLVMGGKNVTANTAFNSEFDKDAKQSNTGSAMRTFAAIMADGRLVFGTGSATFPQIADGLVKKGAISAVSFDGGGSSMLYTQDSGFITPAGRELTTVITVVDKAPAAQKPDMPDIPVVDNSPNSPSSWAKAPIDEAKGLKLIPDWMFYGYKKPITRLEFCALLVQLVPACGGKTADQIRADLGIVGEKFEAIKFTDTDNYQVRLCASLGLVEGFDDGFHPNSTLTREQAATMLRRAANLLGTVHKTPRAPFADQAAISPWAKEGVEFVTTCAIMDGLGGNKFSPKGTFTKEQAFVTMLKAQKTITPR